MKLVILSPGRMLRDTFVLALVGVCASASALTGNDALDWHRSANGKASVPLSAYIRGAMDGERTIEEVIRARAAGSAAYQTVWTDFGPRMFCPPRAAEAQQGYDILLEWL